MKLPAALPFMVMLTPGCGYAAESVAASPAAGLRAWAGLAIVMALILLLYAGARRWLRWPAASRTGIIRIRETRPLGPKKALYLVQVRDRELLLGISGEQITLLSDMPRPTDEATEKEDFEQTLQKRIKDRT